VRLETGPYRPDPDDWQGYFFRGDEALICAKDLRLLAHALRVKSVPRETIADWLDRLAAKLETCRE